MTSKSTQSGRVSKSIGVTTDAPEQREMVLRFSVDLYMPVTARPVNRFVINLLEGEPGSARLLLSRDDGKALEIAEARVETDGLAVTASAVTEASSPSGTEGENEPAAPWGQPVRRASPIESAPGDVWLELRSAPTIAPGTYSGSVVLATNQPDAPEIKLPYTVRVRPMVEARPDVVRLWTALGASDPGRSTILTIRRNDGRSFEITGVEVSHPQLFSAAANPRPPSTQQTVRVGLAEGLDGDRLGGSIQGWVRITTDDSDRPLIEVPVLVAPSRLLSRRPVRPQTAKSAGGP